MQSRQQSALHAGAFIEHRYHLVIEAALLLGIVWLLVQSRAPPPPPKEALTDKARPPRPHPLCVLCRGQYAAQNA